MPDRGPRVGRPFIAGYGIPTARAGLLRWLTVARALHGAPRYWIATTDADGAPHVVQQWGAWVEGRSTSRAAGRPAGPATCAASAAR